MWGGCLTEARSHGVLVFFLLFLALAATLFSCSAEQGGLSILVEDHRRNILIEIIEKICPAVSEKSFKAKVAMYAC